MKCWTIKIDYNNETIEDTRKKKRYVKRLKWKISIQNLPGHFQ